MQNMVESLNICFGTSLNANAATATHTCLNAPENLTKCKTYWISPSFYISLTHMSGYDVLFESVYVLPGNMPFKGAGHYFQFALK